MLPYIQVVKIRVQAGCNDHENLLAKVGTKSSYIYISFRIKALSLLKNCLFCS